MAQRYSKETPTATQPARSSASVRRIRLIDPPAISPTASDGRRYCSIRYVDCNEYVDTAKYLSKTEISEADQAWLRANTKHLDIRQHGDWLYPKKGKPYQLNIWPWRFRIEVHRPYPNRDLNDLAVLRFFAKLPDTIVTAAHIARDFTFDDEAGKYRLLDLFAECWVQRWQRKRSLITFANGGVSTGRRGRGIYFCFYSSKEDRIDGVADCFHGEARVHGAKALRLIGIHSPADLLNFDFTKFWSQKDQSSLREIDKRKLGRYHRNRACGTRDQQPDSRDLRIGGLIWRIYGRNDFGDITSEHFIRHYPHRRSAKNIIGTVDTEAAKP